MKKVMLSIFMMCVSCFATLYLSRKGFGTPIAIQPTFFYVVGVVLGLKLNEQKVS